MNNCGIDLGKKSSRFCIVEGNRNVQAQGWVKMRQDTLVERFGQTKPMRIVLEASRRKKELDECEWTSREGSYARIASKVLDCEAKLDAASVWAFFRASSISSICFSRTETRSPSRAPPATILSRMLSVRS